jgi:hypothetical protein
MLIDGASGSHRYRITPTVPKSPCSMRFVYAAALTRKLAATYGLHAPSTTSTRPSPLLGSDA